MVIRPKAVELKNFQMKDDIHEKESCVRNKKNYFVICENL